MPEGDTSRQLTSGNRKSGMVQFKVTVISFTADDGRQRPRVLGGGGVGGDRWHNGRSVVATACYYYLCDHDCIVTMAWNFWRNALFGTMFLERMCSQRTDTYTIIFMRGLNLICCIATDARWGWVEPFASGRMLTANRSH